MTSLSSTPPASNSQVTFLLRIDGGSFATGFSATLSVSEPAQINPQKRYHLPPYPELPIAYSDWEKTYNALIDSTGEETYGAITSTRKIQPVSGQTTQSSYYEKLGDCSRETVAFEDQCSEWFRQSSFDALRQFIRAEVGLRKLAQVPILLEVSTSNTEQDKLLRKLPWHLWELFEHDLGSSELILSAPVNPSNYQLTAPVNILAIFGTPSGGLQLNGDLATLEDLKLNGANLVLLDQPSPQELQEALWNQHWDILFFAGHSSSCSDNTGGIIHLKDGVILSLRNLKASLNTAVKNGLKLAIFNSCDGLSLSDYLAKRGVPISIVMREPVPDLAARYFLQYLLEAFASGQLSLSTAVRQARERLEWLEANGANTCPAATWLPIICQNPNQSPLFWPKAAVIAPSSTVPPPTPPLPTAPPETPQQPASPPGHSTVIPPDPTAVPSSPASTPGFSPPLTLPSRRARPSQTARVGFNKRWRAVALLVFILIVLGKGVSVVVDRISPGISPPPVEAALSPVDSVDYSSIKERFSVGDRELIKDEYGFIDCNPATREDSEAAKNAGIEAMRTQQYERAATEFNEALAACPAPETMIYRNNARIANQKAYTLAVSVPYTPVPQNAVQMLRGAAMAQTQINENRGVDGVPLKLVVIEDSDSPQVAEDIANELIKNKPEVLGIIGHWTSGVSLSAAHVYQKQQRLVFMTPISVTDDLNKLGDWVFRTTINSTKSQKAIVEHIVDSRRPDRMLDKAAVFPFDAPTDPLAQLYSQDLIKQFGLKFKENRGDVVASYDLAQLKSEKNPQKRAANMVSEAKAKGAQILALAPDNTSVSQAEIVIKAAGDQGLLLTGETNLFRDDVLKNTCPESLGMVMSIPWHPTGRASKDFLTAANRYWAGRRISFPTAMTYNAMQAITEAIRQSPGTPSRESVKDALNSPNFKVLDTADAAPFTFDETHTRSAAAQLVEVKDGGKNEPDCVFEAIK